MEEEKKSKKNIAKKDFVINQNDVFIEIKKGDDISKIKGIKPFVENLKTEKVI